MFRTKKDVDKHSQEIFKTIKTEKERNLRCLSIAQQYYNVRDYEAAKRYVTLYLSVKDDSSVGHKLLAQCYEYFGEKEKALTEYKYSLQLDPKQSELILKVCELLAASSTVMDKNQARYWLEKSESQFPYHPTTFKLKQKVSPLGDGRNPQTMESLIMDELKVRPNDPAVRTKLLTFYVENDRIKDAYDEAFGRNPLFTPSYQWYQCGVQICKLYKIKFPNALSEEFYANYLLVSERTVALSVQDVKISRKSIPECVSFLARFDEILSTAAASMNKSERFQTIVNHMSGQLCYHTANILYRKIKWEESTWQDVTQLIAPLLLLSTAKAFAVSNIRKQNDTLSRVLSECQLHSSYRVSQAGFVLVSMGKESLQYFIEKIFHFCVANWRERIAQKVYSTSDLRKFSESSFFMNCAAFSNLPTELPKSLLDNIETLVAVVEKTQPASLHHLVWLGVQLLTSSGKTSICEILLPVMFCVTSFHSLQFVRGSTLSGYAESLSRIDVDAFLFACVYCAKSSLLQQQINANKPLSSHVLPADVSRLLCSPEHEQWWECAHKLSSQTVSEENFSRVRSVVQRGIEAVRLIGNNSLPLPLLVLLGRTFANKATIESNSEHASALEARALLYWKAALSQLNRIVLDESCTFSSKSMFEYFGKIISLSDAKKLINEGKRFLGMQQIKEKDYSDAMFMNNENYAEVVEGIAATAQQPPTLSSNLADARLLNTLTDQNTKIMDRLETLFSKQELLSSNQLQLFEMVSLLTKRIDDFFLPNEYYLETLSQVVQPLSPGNQAAAGQQNANAEPAKPAVPTFSVAPTTPNLQQPLLAHNIQTNFPLYQPATSVSSYLPPLSMPYPFGNVSVPNITPSVALPYAPIPSFQPAVSHMPFSWSDKFANNAANQYPNAESSTGSNIATPTSQPSSIFDGFNLPTFLPQLTTNSTTKVPTSPVVSNLSNVATPIRSPFTVHNVTPSSGSPSVAAHSFQITVPLTSTVVQSPSVPVPEQEDESDDGGYAEHDPIPDFKPIIPLPDEVEVKTGEEDEEVLFESRVKLFRFADKEWKERGIGAYKILKNRETGRVRVLMRREVVHKICANHFLADNLTLTTLQNNDRAWVYCTPDFAEEKMTVERFCVKFKTSEIAAEFRRVFDEAKTLNAATTPVKPTRPAATVVSPATTSSTASPFSSVSSTPTAPAATPVESKNKPAKKIVLAQPVIKIEEKTPRTMTESKTQFGGFTFTSKPIFSQTAKKEDDKVEEKRKSAFASLTGFNLSSLSKPESGSKLFQSDAAASTVASAAATNDATATTSSPFPSVLKNTTDFSSLSKKSSESSAFVKSKDFKGFAGAGSLVFGSASTDVFPSPAAVPDKREESTVEDDSQGGVGANDEFVPTAEFTPVVPLPELIDVKTGEEGLEVLYEEHCKLFRYIGSEWKERGIGKMKMLCNPTDGSVRLLMRRDQVHKVCCNQRLTADIELKPLKTTEKAWTWSAQDFSEGELTTELLCVRFKTVEQANVFKAAFINAQKSLSTRPVTAASNESKSLTGTQDSKPKLSELFKPKEGSWTCEACYINNTKEATKCVACETSKDGTAAPNPSSVFGNDQPAFGSSLFGAFDDTSKATFSFGAKPPGGPSFGSSAESSVVPAVTSAAPAKFSYGSGSDASVTSSTAPIKFSFSSKSEASAPMSTTFSFGAATTAKTISATTSMLFGSCSNTAKPCSTGTSSAFNFGSQTSVGSQFNFAPISSLASVSGSSTTSIFSFGSPSAMPQKAVSGGLLFGNPSTDESLTEAASSPKNKQKKSNSVSGNNVSIFSGSSVDSLPKSTDTSNAFKSFSFNMGDQNSSPAPSCESLARTVETVQDSIRWCERVPLVVKDENDVLLFESPATLFRYDLAKWNTRGVGDIRMMRNRRSDKYRLLMIREPGEVVCLNHYLHKEMEFVELDQYSWMWSAADFSEGEIVNEKFRLTFDICGRAAAFKTAVDGVLDMLKEANINRGSSTSSDEVEFVSETKVSDEDKKLAESLQLPSNYYAYKYSAGCTGCVGCDEEDLKDRSKKRSEPQVSADTKLKETGSADNIAVTSSTDLNLANKTQFVFGGAGDSSWLSKGGFNFGNVFAPNLTTSPKGSAEDGTSDDEKDASVVPNDHDPYFEPVIPLPDIVETKTGEEEEEIVFRDRSKLFRYDAVKKEWKERGVGELKILHHPKYKSYRLILRRDQVHKVVLNQRIVPTLNLQPLLTSKNSWCWVGMNLTEESDQPVLEQLAARFKTEKITNAFRDAVNGCISQLAEASGETDNRVNESVSSQEENSGKEDKNGDTAAEDEDNYNDEDYGPYDASAEDYGDYEHDYYVDEHGIEDAMEDLDYLEGESETVFENLATLLVIEDDTVVDNAGLVKVVKEYNQHTDVATAYVEFSTPEIPSMYRADIARDSVAVNEGKCITFPNPDYSKSDGKVTLRFASEQLAHDFSSVFDVMKQIDVDENTTTDQDS